MFIKRGLLPWLLASLAGFALASVNHSLFVQARLTDLGILLPLSVRAGALWDDLVGLSPTYLPIIAIGLAIALPCALGLARRWPQWRTALCMLAGFCALLAILLSMQPIMNITLIAGARGLAGLLAQGAAGALAGAVFAFTAPPISSLQST